MKVLTRRKWQVKTLIYNGRQPSIQFYSMLKYVFEPIGFILQRSVQFLALAILLIILLIFVPFIIFIRLLFYSLWDYKMINELFITARELAIERAQIQAPGNEVKEGQIPISEFILNLALGPVKRL